MTNTLLLVPPMYISELVSAIKEYFPGINCQKHTNSNPDSLLPSAPSLLVPGIDDDGNKVDIDQIDNFVRGYIACLKKHTRD